MSAEQSYSAIADGDIYPNRFVRKSASTESRVTQAGAGEQTAGVSQDGTRRIDYIDSTGKAAIAGEPIMYYGPGSRCRLEIVATVSQGDRLKSDTNGKGTPVTTDADEYGAIADQNGTSGQLIWVTVVFPAQIAS